MTIRVALLALALSGGLAFGEPAALSATQYRQDFDAMASAIDRDYAYLASRAEWKRALPAWRAKAMAAKSRSGFVAVLDGALAALHDDSLSVSDEGVVAARRIPAETDLWAEWIGGKAIVTAVRASSVADVAGLHPGHEITSVHGVGIERVVREMVGGAAGAAAARDWALRHVVAGPRAGPYYLGIRENGTTSVLEVVRASNANGNSSPLLVRRIGEGRDLAYIRLRNNLGDPGVLAHFDAALLQMRDTRALILDLRSTEAGGSQEVVRAILGRFIEQESAWQVRSRAGRPREVDVVAPRGPFAYRSPLVVLVDRWTAAEGEALAAGLNAAAGATLIGTRMAGLHGLRHELTLANSGLVLSFPEERAFHVNGKPREALVPDIAVDLLYPSGGPGDPILYQALKFLENR